MNVFTPPEQTPVAPDVAIVGEYESVSTLLSYMTSFWKHGTFEIA